MEFRQLRYFITVAEELHFGRAAERLHMTQPALSKQIQILEKNLEIQLFKRTKRQVQLTQAGQVFLEQTRLLVAQAEQAVQMAKRAARGELGQLTISFTQSALQSVLPEIVRVFRTRYPDVQIAMTEMSTEAQVEALQKHLVDIAFLHPPIRQQFLRIKPLLEEELLLVLPADHPLVSCQRIPLSALAKESFIIHPRHEGPVLYDQFFNLCQEAGFYPNVVQETVMNQARIALVATGIGVTFIPQSLQTCTRSGVVCKLLEKETPKLQLAAAWRQDQISPVLQEFLKVITELHLQLLTRE